MCIYSPMYMAMRKEEVQRRARRGWSCRSISRRRSNFELPQSTSPPSRSRMTGVQPLFYFFIFFFAFLFFVYCSGGSSLSHDLLPFLPPSSWHSYRSYVLAAASRSHLVPLLFHHRWRSLEPVLALSSPPCAQWRPLLSRACLCSHSCQSCPK